MLLLLIILGATLETESIITPTPVIGILSQETYSMDKYFPNETFRSYIAASYVKHIESAGARVIPIWIGRERKYYEDVINKTNGILFPGGATYFNQSDGYADAGQILYDVAVDVNNAGIYYPIWGTCLGMELLMQVSIGGQEIRAHCSSKKVSLPLDFLDGFETSKLFKNAPKEVIETLRSKNVTFNMHGFCITEKNYTDFGLNSKWRLMSTNKDVNGLEFISSYESINYPFYAVQFHPEKNAFEFKKTQNIDHSPEGIAASQYFANFFVNEARKNGNFFRDKDEERRALIYNFYPKYTGSLGSAYEQAYMFTEEDNLLPI